MAYNTLIEKLPAALEAGTPPDISFLYDADTAYYRGKGSLLTSPTSSSPHEAPGASDAALMTVARKYLVGAHRDEPAHPRPPDLLTRRASSSSRRRVDGRGEEAWWPSTVGYGMAACRAAATEDNFMPVPGDGQDGE
jgi:hypothetical protein